MVDIILAGIAAIAVVCYLVVVVERHSEDSEIASVYAAAEARHEQPETHSKLEPTGL